MTAAVAGLAPAELTVHRPSLTRKIQSERDLQKCSDHNYPAILATFGNCFFAIYSYSSFIASYSSSFIASSSSSVKGPMNRPSFFCVLSIFLNRLSLTIFFRMPTLVSFMSPSNRSRFLSLRRSLAASLTAAFFASASLSSGPFLACSLAMPYPGGRVQGPSCTQLHCSLSTPNQHPSPLCYNNSIARCKHALGPGTLTALTLSGPQL
jgi:hypothetical protein